MIRGSLEDLLVVGDGFLVLSQLHVRVPDISGDFESHLFGGVGEDVESHLVHLDSCGVFLLVVVDVPHIHSYPACERVLLSLYDLVVFGEGFLEHPTGFEAKGVVEGDTEGELDIDQISSIPSLSLFSQILLLVCNLLRLLERVQILT